jgi:FKBP-type peptidyl-prolyl cis-trans isomerase (trigger factor)
MTDAHILHETADGLSHTFRISIDAGPVNTALNDRLRDLARTARIPGFRPGRAPLALLRNLHAERIRETIVDHLAIDVARRLIADRALEPSRRPTIQIDKDGSATSDSVTFTLLLEVMPRVELGELGKFSLHQFQVPEGDSEMTEFAREHLRRQLFDALVETHDFPIPKDMAENEYARIARGFEAKVGEQLDDELRDELRQIAERRVRLAILLTEIGRAHGISVPRSEVEALVEAQAERDPQHRTEIIDYYLDHPTALAELQSPLFEERVIEFLLAQSEINQIELSAEELGRKMDGV